MQLNLINLKVQDWKSMLSFYRDVLGLEPVVIEDEDEYAWLDAGGLRLALAASDSFPENDNTRFSLQFEVENLQSAVAALESHGIVFHDKQFETGEGYRMAQFKDPESNVLGLYELV